MSEASARPALPRARIQKNRIAWLYWLIPLGALALCFWFLYRDFIATGPTITVFLQNVEGLEAGNTPVKFRGANIGQIRALDLTGNQQLVRVQARLTRSGGGLARAGSIFWIVRPEVKIGGVTGLRTIISGEYLTVQPGTGPPTNTFVGVEKAPQDEQPKALPIVLLAPSLGALREQSPIFYRGIQVGEVLYFQLGDDAREVMIHARIHEEYVPLVQMNTKFWNAGGLDVHFGLIRGLEVSAESPLTMISGGIEFATPTEPDQPAPRDTAFRLYEKPDDKWKLWAPVIKLHLPEQAAPRTPPPELPIK